MLVISIFSTIIELACMVALSMAFFNGYNWIILFFLFPILFLFLFIRKTIFFGKQSIIYNFNKVSYKNVELIELDSRPSRGAILSTPVEIIIHFSKKRKTYYLGLFFSTKKIESKIKKICQKKCVKFRIKTDQ